jgi:hypothetical protein
MSWLLALPCAWAQEAANSQVVEPTERQLQLNDSALEAMNDENYVRAASLFEESNHLGELNVTYLNLGRAYQFMGRCDDARQALQRVSSAPKVSSPSPDFVEMKAQQYLDDVDETCEASAAPNQEDSRPEVPPQADSTPAPAADQARLTWGYVALGTGVGLAATSGLLAWQASSLRGDIDGADSNGDGFADDLSRQQALDKQADANLYDTFALSGAVAGGVLVGTGLYLLFTTESTASTVAVRPGRDSMSVSWHLRF